MINKKGLSKLIWAAIIIAILIVGYVVYNYGGGESGSSLESGSENSEQQYDETNAANLETSDDVFGEIDSSINYLE